MYPTLFQVAMDYLPIQASAVPCERAFSSGSETLTWRRNRIKPPLMECLQMLKYAIKKRRLNFTQAWASTEESIIADLAKEEEGEEEDSLTRMLDKRTNKSEKMDLSEISDEDAEDYDSD